jgi:hypothetical protein
MNIREFLVGRRRVGRRLVATVVTLMTIVVSASPSGAVATFGFTCANPKASLPAGVKQVVSELMVKYRDEGVAKWGDRAMSLRLRRSDGPTYFVPLSCGATGNCTWAMVASSPARSIGVVIGALIFVKAGGSEWPAINAFTTSGAGEGTIETLEFSSDGYHPKKSVPVEPGLVGTLGRCLDNQSCCPPAT